MRIGIIGSGSIGLYYGANLARSGQDVHFLLRSGLTEAQQNGIRILSERDGELHHTPVQGHADTSSIGPVDLAIIAIKTTQNHLVPDLLAPLVGDNTAVLTLQNGLGNEALMAQVVGAEQVLGGLCFVCLTRNSPATVRHVGHGTVSLGEAAGPPQPRTHAIAETFRSAGIETHVAENLETARWRKLVWNIPFNGLSVTTGGLTVDKLLADPTLNAEVRALMAETIAAANALGHAIPADFADHQITRSLEMGPYQPSTLVDFLAGNELEIAAIWGEPLRQASSAGIPTPHLARLHEQLRALKK